MDTDGKTSLSELQSVNFGAFAGLSVYPNPTKGALNINGLVKGDVVKVTDLVGRTLKLATYDGQSLMNLSLDEANVGVDLISVSRD